MPTAQAQVQPSGPKLWLQANQPLPVQHVPAPSPQGGSAPNLTGLAGSQPISIAAGDLNADGFLDLVVGYGTSSGGFISVHRGNIDAFAPQTDESFQAIGRGEFPSPFLLEANTFNVPISPDYMALGDFLGRGNQDLAVASKGGNILYIFPGDGKGDFGLPQSFTLPAGVDALVAGQFGSAHQPTLALGLSAGKKSSLTLYIVTSQGLTSVAAFSLSGPASNILFGDLSDSGNDVVFLSSGKMQIVRPNLQLSTVSVVGSVSAFALGSFIYDRNHGQQIAILTSDGSVQIVARNEFDPRVYSTAEFNAIRQAKLAHQPPPTFVAQLSFPTGWKVVESFPPVGSVSAGQSPIFFRTRVASNGADDLMWLNAGNGHMAVISHPDAQPGAQTFVPGQVLVKAYNGAPVGALPMRINVDGRPGVLAIHQGELAPSMLMPIPDPTFFPNEFDDPAVPTSGGAPNIAAFCNNTSNTDTSSPCSLREAIVKANLTAGTDTVQLAAGTYTLTIAKVTGDFSGQFGALYVNDSVNIVGAGQNSTIVQAGTSNATGVDMVMAVNEDINPITNATASITNVTLQNGHNNGTHGNDGDGGCMEFDTGSSGNATLSLTNVTLQNCSTTQGNGAGIAIFNFTNPGNGAVTFSNTIVQNNSAVDSTSNVGAGGGGIWVSQDASMTMTSCKVLNNKATEVNGTGLGIGGGIFAFTNTANSRQTSVHASTILGNESAGFGGGIYNLVNLVVDQGTVISGNTAGTNGSSAIAGQQGGGIYTNTSNNGCPTACTDQATLTKVTITGNTASSLGGGIYNGNSTGGGPLTVSFSRLAGNTANGAAPAGVNLFNDHSTAKVTNNWWGTNAAGSTIADTGTAPTFDPFIVLTHTASPQTIRINQSSTLTGDLSKDNHGSASTLSGNLDEIVGLPITFAVGTPLLGSIPQAQPETLGNPVPTVTATFNAGSAEGVAAPTATVDQATVVVDSNLIASVTESGTTATITTVGAHGFATSEFVTIAGVSGSGTCTGYNGSFFPILSTPTATTFTYTAPAGLSTCGGGTASTGLVILQPPSIAKSFNPTTVAENTASTITFTITNDNEVPIDASFTDALPTNLVVATTPTLVNSCGGTVTATASATSISFSNSTLAAGSCTIQVNVQSAVDNNYSNSVTIDSTAAGNGNTSTASLTVINPPHIAKAFNPTTIPLNGTASLTFTLTSSNTNLTLSGVGFTDTLPTGLTVGTSISTVCGGTLNVTNPTGISLTGASIAPGAQCQFSVTVTGTAAGQYTNTTGNVSSTNGGTGNTASANLTVIAPPSIAKVFNPTSIVLNTTTSLQFTITNPNTGNSLTGVSFSDTLPTGLTVASSTSTVCGGTLTTTGPTGISLSGATIAATGQCQFSVTVTGAAAGGYTNTTGAVTSTEGGTGNTASAKLTVVAPPSITKTFNPTTIPVNGTTALTFTITNPAVNTVAEAGVAFNDTLPTGLVVSTPNGLVGSCNGGTVTAVSGSGTISLSAGSIAVNSSCAVTVNVTASTNGVFNNTTGAVTSTNGGTGNTASATLTVASPPSIAKVFNPATIALNGTTVLTFTITNPNSAVALTGMAFTDTLPTGLVVSTPNGLTNNCGGTPSAIAGGTSISLTGGSIAVNSSCTVVVNVTGTAAGAFVNTSGAVSSNEGGKGNTASANLTVVGPPSIAKAFSPNSIPVNGTSTLTITITNPAANTVAESGVAFSDTLPTGLITATPNGLTNSCGGTATAAAGGASISLTGGSIAVNTSCTVVVNVTGGTAGAFTNTSGAVSSTNGGTGNTASANLTVVAPPSIAKVFNPSTIALNATTTLTFTITNPALNTTTENGVAFTDTLPTGLTVANSTSTVCGGTLTTTAPAGIALSGATIATNSNCQFSVTVTGGASGLYTNTTGNVSSTNGGTGNTATATLAVATPPAITKTFTLHQIPLNGATTLTFTITNPNTNVSLTGIAFTDNLPAGLIVASTANLSNTCNGTATAVGGAAGVSLSGGTLGVSGTCAVSVSVQGTTAGVKNNSVQVTSTGGGTGNTSSDTITVLGPPVLIKAFGAAGIPLNGSASLTFTVQNDNTTASLSGIAFSDTLPAGLIISTPNGLTGSCGGGTISATQNTNVISLSGATLAANASCTFSINVKGTAAGTQNNTTGKITSMEGGTGGTASASIAVVAPPTISKAFTPAAIAPTTTSTLSFAIINPAANSVAETGVAFTDTLPANLVVATPNGAVGTCNGGTLTAVAGSGSISLTGGDIAAVSSCVVSVNVTSSVPGNYTNITGAVSSTNGGTGNTATASLAVKNASLTISKTHQGTFHRGQTGAVYTITVSNSSNAGATVGLVTVVDTLPPVQNSLVPTSLTGTGWICNLGTLTCTRSDALAPGASYPAISLTVNIPQNIVNHFTNTATVSGGDDPNSHSGSDSVSLGPPVIITSLDSGTATISPGGVATFQFQVDTTGVSTQPTTVRFVCSGQSVTMACIFSPLAGSQSVFDFTMTVTSLGPSSSLYPRVGAPRIYAALVFPVAGVLGLSLAGRRGKQLRLRLMMLLAGMILLLMVMSGCGSSPATTQPGKFVITVTGVADTDPGTVSGSTMVTLNVQ